MNKKKRKAPAKRQPTQIEREEMAMQFFRVGGAVSMEDYSRLSSADLLALEVAHTQVEWERVVSTARLVRGGIEAEHTMWSALQDRVLELRKSRRG